MNWKDGGGGAVFLTVYSPISCLQFVVPLSEYVLA